MNSTLKYVAILLVPALSGCASFNKAAPPTYGPSLFSEGYTDNTQTLNHQNLYSTIYESNGRLNDQGVQQLARFRAIEKCKSLKFEYAQIFKSEDRGSSNMILRSSTSTQQFPTSYVRGPNGTSVWGGNSLTSTSTWNETVHRPAALVYYFCTNQSQALRSQFRPLSGQDLKPLVKDLLGGLQVWRAEDSGLKRGDVILGVGDSKRIVDEAELYSYLLGENKNSVTFDVLRDGAIRRIHLDLSDIKHDKRQEQNEFAKSTCSAFSIENSILCGY